MSEHQRYIDNVAAYVLGALPELEAEALKRHMMGCAECQEEAARLSHSADLLARSADPVRPPASLRRALLDQARADVPPSSLASARGRKHRFPLAVLRPRAPLAVSMAIVLLAAAAIAIGHLNGSAPERRTLAGHVDEVALPGATAELDIPRAGEPVLRVHGLPTLRAGRIYEVWLERKGDVRPAGALFGVMADGAGAAALPYGLRGSDHVLVTREGEAGAAQPTEPPIITIRT
ncbi:MAG: anti-sigma factor [Actinobacteria bacterium]|nr:anti-sigma factor [Actinomycetota bacterium]